MSTRQTDRVREQAAEANCALAFDGVAAERGGRTVWSEGTFVVPEGATVAVIGPNGSGKSTLLQMILGLITPSAGSISILGAPPQRGDRRIGYVPQRATAMGEMVRCHDLVALGLSGARWGTRSLDHADQDQVRSVIAAVGAADYAHQRLARVSGGQQQRIALAQALVGRPKLLLLDEPLASLDLRNQHEIIALIDRLQAQFGFTVLLVTHDLNPVLSIATSAIYLLDGHPHYDEIDNVVDVDLLTHLYGTPMRVVRTPQGDLFTRGA